MSVRNIILGRYSTTEDGLAGRVHFSSVAELLAALEQVYADHPLQLAYVDVLQLYSQ
jgi:hypothetical protein